jgi:Zn-dependent protease
VRRTLDPGALVAIGLIIVAVFTIRHSISSTTVLVFAIIIPSIILHEISHGVAALAFGDDTARQAGRITLNPWKHVDPVGTLVLPALLALAGLGAFGYAKPVPVNPNRMRNPRNDALWVSLAGPATNLSLAAASVAALRWLRPSGTGRLIDNAVNYFGVGSLGTTDRVLFLIGFLNVTLAVFNALPIPPLDGSALVTRLLPRRALPGWYAFSRYAMAGLLLIVLVGRGSLAAHVFGPAERLYAHLVGG